MLDLLQCSRCAGVINSLYEADDTVEAYRAIEVPSFGYKLRDAIVADELGFPAVPVGLLLEDLVTEEIVEAYRGTRIVVNGPDEWKVDGEFDLVPCPFIAGARTHRGFTTTEGSFRLAGGGIWPAVQLVTGHSLAAAWALLRGARLKASVISFAGPRVGDRAFADAAVQAIPDLVRLVNHPDLVPRVPFDVWPWFDYIHSGPADEFDFSKRLKFSAEAWHSIHVYWNAVDPQHDIPTQFLA